MRSFFGGKRETPFLVLDIEDDFVKAIIMKRKRKGLLVLGSSLRETGNIEKDVSDSIKEAYRKFFLSSGRRERRHKTLPVLLGLPSSMLKARVVPCSLKRDNTFPISKLEELEIAKKVLKQTKEKINREFASESGIMPTDIKYTNFKTLEMKVDGYLVPSLSNLKGSDLSFKTLGVFLPQNDFLKAKLTVENLGFKISKIVHIAEALSDISYTNDLKNIKDISGSLNNSKYVPTLLMSYYAREIF
ncbi:hypothetical protein KKA24_00615 [Patescibacteria group bacterium]|nr:hypothetical protein [Patescibacteria group bacterium]